MEAVLRHARKISASLFFRLMSRADNPSALVLAGTISQYLLSASARCCSSASDTEGFSGKPALGSSKAGAVGGSACSEVTGCSDDGAMMPFSISFAR